ncbi:MAG: hypothetical protein IJY43_01185, partial [Clostridia bacterium]|nr:hypothetical protein [Clostridia bacterium]
EDARPYRFVQHPLSTCHPEHSKHRGAVFAESNFQKRSTNRTFLKGKGQSPLRISQQILIAFLKNVSLRTRAIGYPYQIPSVARFAAPSVLLVCFAAPRKTSTRAVPFAQDDTQTVENAPIVDNAKNS